MFQNLEPPIQMEEMAQLTLQYLIAFRVAAKVEPINLSDSSKNTGQI